MMTMIRILTPGILRRAAVMRALVGGAAVPEPPGVLSCCTLQLLPVRQRWLCTSASSRAAQEPKPTPQSAPTPAPQDVQGRREAEPPPIDLDPLQDKSIGLFQRFKKTFKQYGKVMIPVHLLTSSFWFGTFYYAAMKGVNVVPFLEMIGLPESLVSLLRDSSSGYALTAYAMYKIATPARYAVTLGGTSLSVQYLRKHGYLSTPPPYSEYLQDKMEETREKLSEKMEETKERFSEKMEETKDKLSEKLQETKDRVSERKAFFRKKGE
ncbi:C18orf19-like protein B [Oryzias melastigma]|uniref:C18orf19-like protein B n=1 Tax=Oryzias melastigma TaxID=30732 RepID=A0A3B3BKX1_ORYME|nr:uncharacterized protein C18orf19 homolog A [Oryzias melastigma]XP_036071964.1 uncharacterized protein C18orf19 homolog A [Oryzias melastigma]KAF6729765.1 C18orf19-like protein B [Oryzias melastigma]KAF6737356.1 C18orf19-like protein B [Oryzias melastigma]